MTLWESLDEKQRTVLKCALEEGYLNGVISDYLGTDFQNGALRVFSSDSKAIQSLIPEFRPVVIGMVERGLVEARELLGSDWSASPTPTTSELRKILEDDECWMWVDGEMRRMVMLMPTDNTYETLKAERQVRASTPPSHE